MKAQLVIWDEDTGETLKKKKLFAHTCPYEKKPVVEVYFDDYIEKGTKQSIFIDVKELIASLKRCGLV